MIKNLTLIGFITLILVVDTTLLVFYFFTTIFHFIKNSNNIRITNNMNDFMNLLKKIYLSLNNNENLSFLDIAANNKNYSLDILNNNLVYKTFYHIHHLLNWFFDDKLFCIEYQRIKSCNLCFKYDSEILCYQPFISININELNEIICNKFSNSSSACPFCSYSSRDDGQ